MDELEEYLANTNVKAFLKAIRLGEGTVDDVGYRRIVGGELFTDYSHHPNKRVWIRRYNVWSTAAGAYQIIYSTWHGLVDKYKFADFTPHSQDLAAVGLIVGRKAIYDVLSGNIHAAILKCGWEWASLPGALTTQRKEPIENVLKVYTENGGIMT